MGKWGEEVDRLHAWEGLDVIKIIVEDSGNLDMGSDHNRI